MHRRNLSDSLYLDYSPDSSWHGDSYPQEYFDCSRPHKPGRRPRPFHYINESSLNEYTEVIREPGMTTIIEERPTRIPSDLVRDGAASKINAMSQSLVVDASNLNNSHLGHLGKSEVKMRKESDCKLSGF